MGLRGKNIMRRRRRARNKFRLPMFKRKNISLKITSLDRNMVLVDKSYNLYPLVPNVYPRKMHAFALGSNFDLFLVKVEA